ncbi:MAG: hypothetical protein M3004_09615 [Bacteroidota bacterium]|nr:hypothetical protein [Bacteroidota bacterium]
MKDQINQTHSDDEEKIILPWKSELAVKDLIKPITLRRIRLVQTTGGILLLLAVIGFAYWLFVKPPSGERIVKDMITAAGGMEQWKNIQDGNFVRTHRLYDENGKIIHQSEETFFFKNNEDGHQLLIKSKTNGGDNVVVGHDKVGYWASLNGNGVNPVPLAKELEFMCDDEHCSPLCASEMALYRMSFPFKLADNGVIPRNAGTAMLNGEKAILLDVTFDPKVGHDRWVFYVNPSSKLIRKIEHYPTIKDNVQPEEIYLSDFKKDGNIVLSHSNKYYRSNGKILEEYLISNVKFNSSLAADIFNRPPQLSMK